MKIENKNIFYRDILVKYYNELIDYVKSKRPDFKVMVHIYPYFQPDPLFANRTKSDYCGQTVAWYFAWPLDKVRHYTKVTVERAKDYYPDVEGIPFVGLNARKDQALAHKTPEQLEKELQTIRKRLGNLNVLVSDVVVTFPEDREKTAYVRLTVNVSWRKVKQPPYTVKLTMSKEAGDWLVTGITFLENKKTPVP